MNASPRTHSLEFISDTNFDVVILSFEPLAIVQFRLVYLTISSKGVPLVSTNGLIYNLIVRLLGDVLGLKLYLEFQLVLDVRQVCDVNKLLMADSW